MKTTEIREKIESMAALPGITACALVDGETGMVWHASSQTEGAEVLAEAASDYWRLYTRLQPHFAALGALQTCAMMHAQGMITLVPCGPSMIMVAVANRMQANWQQWQQEVRAIARLLADSGLT